MSKADGQYIAIEFTEELTNSAVVGSAYRQLDDATLTALNYYSSQVPAYLNDGSLTTYWRGTTAVNWINAEFTEAKIAHGFRWYIYSSTYYPLTFTISGSNDGSTWTQLGETFTGTSTVGWQEFSFTNTTAYKYYQVDILTANSSRLYISEFQLLLEYGNEQAFTLSGKEYNYQPEGVLVDGDYQVNSVEKFYTVDNIVDFSEGTLTNTTVTNGVLELEEDV